MTSHSFNLIADGTEKEVTYTAMPIKTLGKGYMNYTVLHSCYDASGKVIYEAQIGLLFMSRKSNGHATLPFTGVHSTGVVLEGWNGDPISNVAFFIPNPGVVPPIEPPPPPVD